MLTFSQIARASRMPRQTGDSMFDIPVGCPLPLCIRAMFWNPKTREIAEEWE